MLPWILGALGLTGGGIGIAALLGGGPAMLLGAKWLWSWLSHATFLQVVCGVLAAFALVQHFELAHARKQAVNYSRQRDEYKHQLDGISTKRNEQQIVTRDRIVTVIKTLKSADQKAKIVEAAPLPGQCKSPPEVLGADL